MLEKSLRMSAGQRNRQLFLCACSLLAVCRSFITVSLNFFAHPLQKQARGKTQVQGNKLRKASFPNLNLSSESAPPLGRVKNLRRPRSAAPLQMRCKSKFTLCFHKSTWLLAWLLARKPHKRKPLIDPPKDCPAAKPLWRLANAGSGGWTGWTGWTRVANQQRPFLWWTAIKSPSGCASQSER